MDCPHCHTKSTRILNQKIRLGYHQYHCCNCGKQFNERSGTPLNFIEYPTEVVMIAVFYYYRFKVSLDDVVELMPIRGFNLSHQTMHNWVKKFGIELDLKLRTRRYKNTGDKWHADTTYLKIEGRWCYLYRAIDKEGNLVDVYLSDVCAQATAEAFFKQAAKTTGIYPEQITTDKKPALYPAIENTFDEYTTHRDNKHMNNRLEQDHRGVKSRTRPMKGFKDIVCALIFCTAFEEIRQLFRTKIKTRAEKRGIFATRFQAFNNLAAEIA